MRCSLCKVQPGVVLARFVRCLHWVPRRRWTDNYSRCGSVQAAAQLASGRGPTPLFNDSLFPESQERRCSQVPCTFRSLDCVRCLCSGLRDQRRRPADILPQQAQVFGIHMQTVVVIVHLCLERFGASTGKYIQYLDQGKTHVYSRHDIVRSIYRMAEQGRRQMGSIKAISACQREHCRNTEAGTERGHRESG
ncbi:hypothetical protein L226DRAFT_365471 [Lentinus tigrinus ALCF2SS1-7]|uniref:uncharacterized protein n=1 Tax=Lentinus tigrinus ALCF2SS1-7 TaxID=1328758 RepID=UPI001165D9F8|nr:hypothetical protein L226DRAFT_365471 [Lentinus tigrinus ALCF2SS1-7]